MKLQGAIFDLDGTLGNTLPVCIEAFRRAFYTFTGRHYTDQEITALFGPSEEGSVQQVVPDRWTACLEAYLDECEVLHAQYAIRPFPGIEDALRLLRGRGVALAIVTGKGPRGTEISLRHLGLTAYFDDIKTGSPDGPVKPSLIREVLSGWSMPPDRVVYIGDAPSDVDAAREAGVIPLGAAWAPTSDAEGLSARHPLATFRDVETFITWLENGVDPA